MAIDPGRLLYWIFILATWGNLFFWLFVFIRIRLWKVPKNRLPKAPEATLIICARNEAENLQKNLRRFLSQTCRSLRIIVVNHKSVDHTAEVLLAEQKTHRNFRIVNIDDAYLADNKQQGKKEALEAGIKASSTPVLLLSDADCVPASEQWAEKMLSLFLPGREIVLGFSPYKRFPGMLNRWIRYETAWTAMQYFGFALCGMPYMGVGRNLAYRREVFDRAGGFHTHRDLLSGDDDLLVNAVATKDNVGISLDPDTFVYSEPAGEWKQYLRQKKRHMTAGRRYRKIHQFLLGLLALTQILHYTGGGLLMMMGMATSNVFIHIVVRMVLVWSISAAILYRFREKDLIPWIPLMDALVVVYYLAFLPTAIKGKTDSWK